MFISTDSPEGAELDPSRPPMVVRVGRTDSGDLRTTTELGGIELSEAVSSMLAVAIACIATTPDPCSFWLGLGQRLNIMLEAVNQHGEHND